MKWIRRIAVLLILLLVVIGVSIVFLGGTLIKEGVEKVGPKVTGVPVTLDKAFLFPVRGQAGLNGLTVANPEGFNTAHLMKLDGIDVDVDMASLKTDTIVINSIVIEKPDISYEMSLKGSNLKALLKGMEKSAEGGGENTPAEDEDVPTEEGGGKKIIIKKMQIVDGKVRISTKLMQGLNAPIPLPDIEITDIGKEEGSEEGTSIPGVIALVLKEVFGAVTSVATGSIKLAGKGVMAVGEGAVDGVKVVGTGAAEGAKLAGEGVVAVGEGAATGVKAVGGGAVKGVKAVGSGAGSIVKGVGGLLTGGEDAPEEDAEEPQSE